MTSEVRVYIWEKSDNSSFGHTAMGIENTHYISYWPSAGNQKSKRKKTSWQSTVHTYSDDYDEDTEQMGRKAEHIISLFNLSTYEMKMFWGNIRKNKLEYHLLARNCASIVAYALQVGCEPKRLENYLETLNRNAILNIKRSENEGTIFFTAKSFFPTLIRSTGLLAPLDVGTKLSDDRVITNDEVYNKFMNKTPGWLSRTWTPMQIKQFSNSIKIKVG